MAFIFRASAALDVRRKQEDAARQALAAAEAMAGQAAARVDEAVADVRADAARLVALRHAGTEAWQITLHEAWLGQQRRIVAERTRDLETRRAEAAAAAGAVIEAATRRKVVERLRDRAWRRYLRAEHEQHIREMNELATLRFVAQAASDGGTRAD
jgi:flagellar export protein FliJ